MVLGGHLRTFDQVCLYLHGDLTDGTHMHSFNSIDP